MAAADSWIVDVDALSFAQEVVERSKATPVLIDFWAEWCGPCATLGPLLEKLAREEEGRFVLAKVDVDKNPELAQAFRVQSIPTVIAVADGRPLDGFQGSLPESELRSFLDRVAPSKGGGERDELAEATRLAEAGEAEKAVLFLRDLLRRDPGHVRARTKLADLLVDAEKPEEAKKVLEKLTDEQRDAPAVRVVLDRIAFVEGAASLDELRRAAEDAPGDAKARLELGRALVAARDYEAGLAELLESLRLDPSLEGGAAKQKMLEVFELLGLEDPLANEYRFKLSLEIFS